jgi:hypothetical protein
MTSTEIPTHFTPLQRRCVRRFDDLAAWENPLARPVLGRFASRAALIDALRTIDQDALDTLDRELADDQDRVEQERERWRDFDPHKALNDARAEESRAAYEFRHSQEGREERIIELLESIDAKLAGGGR